MAWDNAESSKNVNWWPFKVIVCITLYIKVCFFLLSWTLPLSNMAILSLLWLVLFSYVNNGILIISYKLDCRTHLVSSPCLCLHNGITLVHYVIAEVVLAGMLADSVGTWVGGRRWQMAVPLSLPYTHVLALSRTRVLCRRGRQRRDGCYSRMTSGRHRKPSQKFKVRN